MRDVSSLLFLSILLLSALFNCLWPPQTVRLTQSATERQATAKGEREQRTVAEGKDSKELVTTSN